jgi:hypothetical protein
LIDIFEFATTCIVDYQWPRLIGFSECNRIGMTRATIATESFVRYLSYVRTSNHYWYTNSTNRISDSIGLGDHPRHSSNPNESDSLLLNEVDQLPIGHRLCISIDKQNLVT